MRWIKTRASVSLQRDSARRPSAVRRRREARVEGERSELATTRRRQSVRRAAITRSSNLRRAALGRGKKAQRSGASGKPACKSCRRGVKRTQVQAQMGWRRATRDKLWRRRQAVGSSRLGHGKLGRGVEGSQFVGKRGDGRRERVVTNERKVESRAAGECWTERNTNGLNETTPEREVDENGEPPTAGTFLGATSAANPAARRGQAPRGQDRNRNHSSSRFFSSRRDGWSPLFAAVDGPVELIAGPVIAFCFPPFPLCTTNNEGARPRESFSLFPSSHNRLDMESSLFLGRC